MFRRFLNSISIKWKMILAVSFPIVALIAFAGLFVVEQIQTSRQIAQTVQLTEFSSKLSDLVHELQKERGRTAGFVASGGGDSEAQLLDAQRSSTDKALHTFQDAAEGAHALFGRKAQNAHFENVVTLLDEIAGHRAAVSALELDLPASVGGYTEIVDALILLVHDELSLLTRAKVSTEMQGLIALMRAKEAAGLERAQGNAAFSSSSMPQQRHQTVISLISLQDEMFDEFASIMPDDWKARLNGLLNSDVSDQVGSARSVLISSGYDGAITGYTGPEWFDMTTARINELKAFENDLLARIQKTTLQTRAETNTHTWIAIAITLLVIIPSIAFALVLVSSIVRPMRQITENLDALAAGKNDVEIAGQTRGDEIGVMARAAFEFLNMSKQREELRRQSTEQEKHAVQERRKVLTSMADTVESATQSTWPDYDGH